MHRSGTTMVAQLLDELGLFLGAKVQSDHEALYFLETNDLLLNNVNAAWDNPEPFLSFLEQPTAVDMSLRCLRGDLTSRPLRRFLGLKRYFKARSIERFDQPWGWKDPRNVYTLPLWLKLFPQARIINILRNGVDVAASLIKRERVMLQSRQKHFSRRYSRLSSRSKLERAGYRGSSRCLTPAGAFELWNLYTTRAQAVLQDLPNAQTTIIYEEFLQDPTSHLHSLIEFCQLPGVTPQAIDQAASKVNTSRSTAFLKDPELRAFYQTVRNVPAMKQYHYDQLD